MTRRRTLQVAARNAGLTEYEAGYTNARFIRQATVTDMTAYRNELAGVSYLADY